MFPMMPGNSSFFFAHREKSICARSTPSSNNVQQKMRDRQSGAGCAFGRECCSLIRDGLLLRASRFSRCAPDRFPLKPDCAMIF
jgi:hypothetical protein